jgi:hypothetical protein
MGALAPFSYLVISRKVKKNFQTSVSTTSPTPAATMSSTPSPPHRLTTAKALAPGANDSILN